MKNAVKHVIRVLNIKDADALVADRLTKEMTEVDIPSYLGYIEKHHNHADLSFMTGYQKFLELTKKYKAGVAERNARPQIEAGYTRAKELAQKVRETKETYEKSEYQRAYLGYTHKELNFHNFKGYLTDEDTALLKIIGNLGKCLHLQESSSGGDALEDKLSEILKAIVIRGVSQIALEDKSANRDVMKLANTTVRKF